MGGIQEEKSKQIENNLIQYYGDEPAFIGTKHFICFNSFLSSQQPYTVATVITSIFQLEKLRQGNIKKFNQGHMAMRGRHGICTQHSGSGLSS